LKRDGTRAETRFRLSAKRKSPFKSVGASVQSTTGSRGVRISGSNARYTIFQGSVKGTGYSLHSPVSPSLPLPCVTVCFHISTGVYPLNWRLVGSKSWAGHFEGEKSFLHLQGIEPRFLGCLACNLMSVPTHPNQAKNFESRAKFCLLRLI
jgi:hypothetical protein